MFFQDTLFGGLEPDVDPGYTTVQRHALDAASWVDLAPDWMAGSGQVFDVLLTSLSWRSHRRVMFDHEVDEPRRSAWWSRADGEPEPLPLLARIRSTLGERYERDFDSIGFNLYRDGDDSVAWHGDRHREHVADPVVAILSVGTPRTLRLRPRGGGSSRSWNLGHGDLFVMGGACQHDWEHSIPKSRRVVGPRISITFRHGAASSGVSARTPSRRRRTP